VSEKALQLRELTTLAVGGSPLLYLRPADEQGLAAALRQCEHRGLPWRVLGGGSNLLAGDGPLPFAVIHVHAPGLAALRKVGPAALRAGAGVTVGRLLALCRREGLAGLEFMAGIPGTVGGALAGNAGAWGRDVCSALRGVRLLHPDGQAEDLPAEALQFGYRRLALGGAVVVEAEFQMRPSSPELVGRRMARYVARRRQRQPAEPASAGCVFKNPAGHSAGRLLDLCGLKGRAAGDARISTRHANFIVNCGGASCDDVLALIEQMREAVHREFGLGLELELKHWPGRTKAA
jgi:UDP-N-acetylmuramate dehydrogenase